MHTHPACMSVIPDGNRRWAKKNGFPLKKAYVLAGKKFWELIEWALEENIKVACFYLLSKDNLTRDEKELKALHFAIENELDRALSSNFFDKNSVCVEFAGGKKALGEKLFKKISMLEKKTAKNRRLKAVFFYGYSGQEEIVENVKKIMRKKPAPGKEKIRKLLQQFPAPDILIRTGGEKRLSDFLLFQHADTELFFLEKLWPQITKKEFLDAVNQWKLSQKGETDF